MQAPSKLTRRTMLSSGIAVGAAAVASAPQIANAAASKRVFRFAHLTDVHVQPERAGGEGMAACLHHVQNQQDPPSMILFGGDNVMDVSGNTGDRAKVQLELWKKVLKEECSLPYKVTIGNHDVYGGKPDGKNWAIDAYDLPNRYYTFDEAGWRFIILDSTSPQESGYKGKLDDEQFQWLQATIQETPSRMPICIECHIPIIGACAYFDGSNEKSGDWVVPGAWMHIDARRIKDLFHQHPNIKLALSGHIHLVDQVQYLGVKYACNGAVCGGWWGGPCQEFDPGYALVDLYEDGSTNVEYINYGWAPKE